MNSKSQNVAPFYKGWRFTNERLVERIGDLSLKQLELRPGPDLWPIWAMTAHLAGARVYWLCAIFKEPGAERAPFVDATGYGWEDDLTHPRGPRELIFALESSWKIVAECLQRWTPEMLQEEFRRESRGQIEIHTRQSVLMRLLTHDAYHGGEISQTLGMNGLKELDLWAARARTAATPQ
ncbi:MAG TPA: DinB family protein [Candidatus Dormibacteraeota bacterium]|nr:DinB family protein [Candidatus Dormibacteraeota bacterium]